MGLDSSNNRTLWMDRVALELNTAILHSFSKHQISIVDQHSASDQFMIHFKNEMKERGGCPADWVWLTPSQSGSLTPVYHQEQLHYHLSPKYLRQVGIIFLHNLIEICYIQLKNDCNQDIIIVGYDVPKLPI